MNYEETKLRAGRLLKPAKIAYDGDRIYIKFGFNKELLGEIKNMEGAKWHGFDEVNPQKVWSVKNSRRNNFQLEYLKGNNPYSRYDTDLPKVEIIDRPLYSHQIEAVSHMLTRKQCILAGEMGVGKTLAAIVVMEKSGFNDWWFIGTRSSILSVELELRKWESRITPRLLTYDALRKLIKNWEPGTPAPRGVVFDESARLKNRTSQRSQAAMHLAESIREEHGTEGYVILMTGTPSPKSPVDWWNQAEIACPGFLVEGTDAKLKNRLCLVEQRESMYGQAYPHLVTWFDNEDKCKKCGQLKTDLIHEPIDISYHAFEPSINEISKLYKRLKGLVLVQLKKDCLDLPDKIYRIIRVTPDASLLRAAKAIVNTASSTIKALTMLRELSDGFQYVKVETGKEICPLCNGNKTIDLPDPSIYTDGNIPKDSEIAYVKDMCPHCNGTGEQSIYERQVQAIHSPKDDALDDLLDEYSEVGRLVIFAGFTGSIDKICDLVTKNGWHCLRIDGRGWKVIYPDGTITNEYKDALMAMDYKHPNYDQYEKLVVVGHPGSASEGLTLTASPAIVYYSNDFTGMYRMQSEDRIHRAGMDTNRGATIIDIYNLPSDEYVHNNLKQKKDLQSLSLGELEKEYNGTDS